MSVLAVVTRLEDVEHLVAWASQFARSHDTSVTYLCWGYAATPRYPLLSEDKENEPVNQIATAVRELIGKANDANDSLPDDQRATIRSTLHPDANAAAIEYIHKTHPTLVLAVAHDESGRTGATYATNPLLRETPCDTIIFFGTHRDKKCNRVFVGISGSTHDATAITIASKVGQEITLAQFESDGGDLAIDVGRRELQRLMRATGIRASAKVHRRVFLADDTEGIRKSANKHDLVLIGANDGRLLRRLLARTSRPTVAIVKRKPPLKVIKTGGIFEGFLPRMSAADYADLIQNLRRGSKLNGDFVIMLGLASAIASLGLLQNSPAVVIGSMLLAPLMTPMICSGLAVAQANPRLGRSALLTVLGGFLVTLAISIGIAIITPGEEITSEVLARGDPNLLDLLIAICSAVAAAYALARPDLIGAVAGVAIATALVPPLCSLGISLAYRHIDVAQGAGLLFLANLVAIVLGAALTFRLLGVTPTSTKQHQRAWVYRVVAIFAIAIIILVFPLERALQRTIDMGKPQPNYYPVTAAVAEAVNEFVSADADVSIISGGRPASSYAHADVVIVITSDRPLPRSYGEQIAEIVRRETDNPELKVAVHCVREAWEDADESQSQVEAPSQ